MILEIERLETIWLLLEDAVQRRDIKESLRLINRIEDMDEGQLKSILEKRGETKSLDVIGIEANTKRVSKGKTDKAR